MFVVLMHINVFRAIFSQRTCNTAHHLLCQRMNCVQDWCWTELDIFAWSWQIYLWTLTWLVRPWNLHLFPAEMACDQRLCCNGCSGQSCCKTSGWIGWNVLLSLRKAGVTAKTSKTSIWSCWFRIGISGSPANRYAQSSFHSSVLSG